jgi:hypothetical protein
VLRGSTLVRKEAGPLIPKMQPMRITILARSIICACGLVIGTYLPAQVRSPCTDLSEAQGYRDYYGVVVSLTDSATTNFRARTGLPTLSDSQVRIIADTAVCRRASRAYDATLEVPYPQQPVVVLELGNRRIVVKDIGFRGGVMLNLLFDETFTTLIDRFWH